ncbi:MAG: AraC family transcriptional regulator [Oscillospiraceae bacterium]|nr:AraC family transcriptional regulator [Oscillospiraceae bacterium]
MDWITGIQRALDYTEAHLTETVDYEAAADAACASPFHFQRMFTMLCGFTLGDYVRMRRLSLAAEDLLRTRDRVIDVALRYGYDTPESFTRAFSRFHGVSPTQARRGKNVKSFSRLSVKLILSGGNSMDYRIEKLDAFRAVCRKKQVEKPQGDTATADISAFWDACMRDGTMEQICRHGRFDTLHGVLGICFSQEMEKAGFPYAIGAQYNGEPIGGDRLELVDIPAHTYAVFTCRGSMPEAFRDTYKRICSEFFPQSNYEYCPDVELEVYPSDDVKDPGYSCEIWIAVSEKK